jgi:hypothetical protein
LTCRLFLVHIVLLTVCTFWSAFLHDESKNPKIMISSQR